MSRTWRASAIDQLGRKAKLPHYLTMVHADAPRWVRQARQAKRWPKKVTVRTVKLDD